MELQVTDLSDGTRRVVLHGRLDVAGVDAVEKRFAAAAAEARGPVAVDMRGVSFVASLGLRMFVAVARALEREGRRMALFACQPAVAEVFEMAALDDLFPVLPSEESARAALA